MAQLFGAGVTNYPRLTVFANHAIDPNVYHDRPRLDPVSFDQTGAAGRNDYDIGSANDLSQIARGDVGHRDGAFAFEQKQCNWLANNVGLTDKNRPQSAKIRTEKRRVGKEGG